MQKRVKGKIVSNGTLNVKRLQCPIRKMNLALETKENEIRESELRYWEMVELSPEPIIVHQEEIIVYINPSGVKVFGGNSPSELIGRPIYSLVHPDSLEIAKKRVHQLTVELKATDPLEEKFLKLDGTPIDVEVRAVPITYKGKKAIQLLCKDITERKKAELSLLETEQRYRSLVENNPDAICCFDLDGNFISANPATEIMTGYTKHELLQLSYISLFDPEHSAGALHFFEKTKAGKSQIFESVIMRKNGSFVECTCKNVPIIINDRIVGVFLISRDITAQKETEELLRKSDKLSIVGQLAAGVAHEIRNPLTSLKGFTQLLKTKYKEENDYFEIMLSELNRIHFIVNEFMSVAKPQITQFQIKNLNKTISDVISLMNAQAIMSNVEIEAEYKDDLPDVRCDESQLKQVFINIIKNAVEAMPKGGKITISFDVQLPNFLKITFTDEGCGIPEERIKQLGEPFYTTKEKGTGLGLMVCFKIIEAHGGNMNIRSKLHSGTSVEISLPL
jgi:PAS domain S-box-containing protein